MPHHIFHIYIYIYIANLLIYIYILFRLANLLFIYIYILARKKLRFILSVKSDFHMIDSLSINAFVSRVSISFSVDETLKRCFFQSVVVSILLYGCPTKKLDGNYTRMLQAILNKSWRQHPTKHQLYGHLPPIMKTIHVRRTRHAGHCWKSRDELISDILLWTPHMAVQKQDGQLEHIYSISVRIRDIALKTCQRRWTIGRSGERGPGISVQAAWHDDDEYIYIYREREFSAMHLTYIKRQQILWQKTASY